MKTFQCTQCGYYVQQATEPFRCPQCNCQRIGLFRLVGDSANPYNTMPAGQGQGGFQPQGGFQQHVFAPHNPKCRRRPGT